MSEQNKTAKKLTGSVITIILLAVCLCITTFALVYSTVAVEGHLFQTGTIQIDLNGGQPVITEHEYLFEPGITVEKPFYIENQGTWDVYYKLYFDNAKGGLADVLEVKIRDGDTVLFDGKIADLTKEKVGAADDVLRFHERRELTISFHYPEEAGNSGQAQYLSFDLKADAVQTKNNPNRLFE